VRVADRLSEREASWRELDRLVDRLSRSRFRRLDPADALRLGELYRGVCSDLMLADSYDLPRETVAYLHALVGRAHNSFYRARGFRLRDLGRLLFDSAPRRLRGDPALRLAAAVFVVAFLLCGLLAAGRPGFARQVVGDEFIDQIDQMYSQPVDSMRGEGKARDDTAMAGFYIQHNTSIGLQCFAWGILLGLGSLYQLLSNAIILGTLFGHMAVSPSAGNFFTFVTAHSSFELTAIVVAAAAGLRMGWGLIDTRGQTRLGSLRREAANALPALGTSVVLFVLAAFVEGFVSASSLPYWTKAGVAVLGAMLIVAYLTLGGRGDQGTSNSAAAPWRVPTTSRNSDREL
jgi:uncharacterized membrane protein SpoIIM required for sporulation